MLCAGEALKAERQRGMCRGGGVNTSPNYGKPNQLKGEGGHLGEDRTALRVRISLHCKSLITNHARGGGSEDRRLVDADVIAVLSRLSGRLGF